MKAVSLKNTKFIFTEPTEPTVHQQKCVNDDGIQSLTPNRLAGGSSPSPHVFYFVFSFIMGQIPYNVKL